MIARIPPIHVVVQSLSLCICMQELIAQRNGSANNIHCLVVDKHCLLYYSLSSCLYTTKSNLSVIYRCYLLRSIYCWTKPLYSSVLGTYKPYELKRALGYLSLVRSKLLSGSQCNEYAASLVQAFQQLLVIYAASLVQAFQQLTAYHTQAYLITLQAAIISTLLVQLVN